MAKRAEAGPFAFMVVLPGGKKISMARTMITGFVIQIVGALLLCFFMLMVSGGSGGDFKRRIAIAVCFGLTCWTAARSFQLELVALSGRLHTGDDL